jgi:hypothetical protein
MSQSLIVLLSDEAFAGLQRQALAAGTSVAALAAASLERQCRAPGPVRSEGERQAARARFEQHIGELDLGRATGADNEQIDADLAAAYASAHEGG